MSGGGRGRPPGWEAAESVQHGRPNGSGVGAPADGALLHRGESAALPRLEGAARGRLRAGAVWRPERPGDGGRLPAGPGGGAPPGAAGLPRLRRPPGARRRAGEGPQGQGEADGGGREGPRRRGPPAARLHQGRLSARSRRPREETSPGRPEW